MSKTNLPAVIVPSASELVPVIDSSAASGITTLARRQVQVENEIARLEGLLSEQREILARIQQDLLPSAFEAAGNIRSMQLAEGWEVSIDEVTVANITEQNRQAAHEWLREHKLGALIKRVITVSFGKGEEKKSDAVLAYLNKRKIPCAAKEAVHPQTLKAFVNESIRAGRALPSSIDVHKLPKSIIRRPKDGE